MIKKIIFVICWIAATNLTVFCCDCISQLSKLDKKQVESFDLVFVGQIIRIKQAENNCIAFFKGITLYHGVTSDTTEIHFDCSSSCEMPFNPGETWLIYAMKKDGTLSVDYCERSRKKPSDKEQDDYIIYSGISYKEETGFLAKYYPAKDFAGVSQMTKINNNEVTVIDQNRNLPHADTRQKIWLLLGSFVVLLLIYAGVRFFWKK